MNEIKKIRIVSLYLFITSLLGILGTLIISNLLVTYKISFYNYPFKYNDIKPILCNKENNFCRNFEILFNSRSEKLDTCRKETYSIDIHYLIECETCEGTRIPAKKFFKSFFNDNKFIGNLDKSSYLRFNKLGGEKNWKDFTNHSCILNSKFYDYYLYFPSFFNGFTKIIDKIKNDKRYKAGHSLGIMPYLYGESSISNIAKRFPTNYLFKSFMFLSSFLIFIYWRSYNSVINKITNQKKIKIFYVTGVLSSIFLFLHILFLGINIEILNFEKIKKLILILFIFFEIFAQSNLVFNLYKNEEKIKKNINRFYLELKKYLIIFILIIFIIGIFVFIIMNTGSEFNNIIEWNFFTLLIFFYLFSYFMWTRIF